MISIIWSFLWFTGSILLIVFAPQLDKWTMSRQSKKTGKPHPNPSWQRNSNIIMVRVLWTFIAINSAIGLFIRISNMASSYGEHLGPEIFYILISFYRETYVYPMILLLFGGFASYLVLKYLYYSGYAPIFIVNLTKQPITININKRRIGIANPGKKIRNNRVLISYDKYSIEAINTEGIVTYSKEFSLDDLDTIDWKIIIKSEE